MYQTKEDVKGLLLAEKWGACYHAHSNTSFSPEKRATGIVKSYSEQLEQDLKLLGENQGNYKEKYIACFDKWISAKGRCISSMITGGSNFPVRRAIKANNHEHSAYENFQNWREKYFNAVNRVPTKSPEDDLDLAEKKLEKLMNFQLEAKEINKAVRKLKTGNFAEILDNLLLQEFSKEMISLLDERGGKWKIPAYKLTNNNARIKSTEQKVKIMQNRIDTKMSFEDITFEGGYVTIEDDRVKVFHDEKPSAEIRTELKSNGFRYSPNWVCWCRKHTANGLYAAKNLTFVKA